MLQRSSVNRVFFAKDWLQSGWRLFKQAPITWVFMILLFSIAYIIAITSLPGRAIAALLAPVFLGGIYVAAFRADNGEPISMECLFSMFQDKQKLQQLLTIGGIGVAVVGFTFLVQNMTGSSYSMRVESGASNTYEETTLGSTLSSAMFWLWSSATIFAIPLVAIANQDAVGSLKSSIFAALSNVIPLFIFLACAVLLTIVSIIPFGLGLFVAVPTLFCALYFIFKTIYLDASANADVASALRSTNESSNLSATALSAASAPIPDALKDLDLNPSNRFEQFLVDQVAHNIRQDTDMSLPKGFTINYFDDYLQITRRWLSFQTFGAFVGTAVTIFLWMHLGLLEMIVSDRELHFKLFSLIFVAMGVFGAYMTLASALNKTQIYVNEDVILIHHHPIPWPGNKRVDVKNIEQVYVKTVETHRDERTHRKYHVEALTDQKQSIKLVSGLQKYQPAHFIEKKIEDYLSIEDAVVGEG